MSVRGLVDRCWYTLIWCPCWAFSKLWFRFRCEGRNHVPATGPVLIVCNHQSHLDPVLAGVACPRQLRALARKSLFFWPLGWMIRSLGAVPVDRGGSGISGIKAILKMLGDGDAVIIFPEGTRTRDGQLQPFQAGFAAIARRSNAAIVPVAIHGAFEAMPRGQALPRPLPITLVFGTPIGVDEVARQTDDELIESTRARIAQMLDKKVSGRLCRKARCESES
jgi:1-acyl-sn-glycerol-3-phosphate acyltransferase